MKAVMISIQPKWCELIASGKKTTEVRKTRPKLDVPFKCYIYCTYGNALADLSNCQSVSIENEVKKGIIRKYALQEHKINGQIHSTCAYGNGKVIGEFICDKIYNLVQFGGGIAFADEKLEQLEPQLFRDMGCLTDEQTEVYLNGKDGRAWHISDLKIYDKPKELREFKKAEGCNLEFKEKNMGICERIHCKNYNGDFSCCDARYDDCLTIPFQSWGYVEELTNETLRNMRQRN